MPLVPKGDDIKARGQDPWAELHSGCGETAFWGGEEIKLRGSFQRGLHMLKTSWRPSYAQAKVVSPCSKALTIGSSWIFGHWKDCIFLVNWWRFLSVPLFGFCGLFVLPCFGVAWSVQRLSCLSLLGEGGVTAFTLPSACPSLPHQQDGEVNWLPHTTGIFQL